MADELHFWVGLACFHRTRVVCSGNVKSMCGECKCFNCLFWILSIQNTYAYILSISMLLKQCMHIPCTLSFLPLCIVICNECELQNAERMPQNLQMIAEIKRLLFIHVAPYIVHGRRFIYCKSFMQLKYVCAEEITADGCLMDGPYEICMQWVQNGCIVLSNRWQVYHPICNRKYSGTSAY